MKIIYLHQYYKTPDMHGGTRSYEFARRLASWGHEVHIITSWTDETAEQSWFQTEEDGVYVHWLPVPYENRMRFWRRVWAFLVFALRAGKKARAIGGDVVFATSTPLTVAIPGVRSARAIGVPLVFEVRDLWPEMPIAMGTLRNPILKAMARWLERFAYNNATHVVALSPGMRDGILAVRRDADITVIPNSCDLELFDAPVPSADDFLSTHEELRGSPIVSYSGTFGAVNGVDYLARIAAASAAQGSDIKYVAIGHGANHDQIEAEARKLGVLGRNFFMYPPIPKREIPGLMRATSLPLSLFIDVKEMQANSANKFFDALASSNAVAINYGGWQADLVEEWDVGIVLPSEDASAAAIRIIGFLADKDRVATCGKHARALAESQFSRSTLAHKLEGVLLQAVESQLKTKNKK